MFYGPRFFLFASIPAALALAARLVISPGSVTPVAVSVMALALSLWVGFTSAVAALTPNVCVTDDFALEHLCWYTPEFSPLWRPLIDCADSFSRDDVLRVVRARRLFPDGRASHRRDLARARAQLTRRRRSSGARRPR